MRIYQSFSELVGATPLVQLNRFAAHRGLDAVLLGKVEGLNPAGSVKDRIAMAMVDAAEKAQRLRPGGVIIEPTSGNTGIGLAAIAASRGYRCILVMPDTMSPERSQMLHAYGAEIIYTPGAMGMKGAIAKAAELAREIDNSFVPSQFENAANPDIHYRTTGPEIWEDTQGKVDIFISGVGTGGTITGAGRYLKERNPLVRVIAVEPTASPVLSGGEHSPHKIQGIGAGFIPTVLDTAIYDEVVQVTNEEAFEAGLQIAHKEGLLIGVSGGAAMHAAAVVAGRPENKGKHIVVILPDSGDRYLTGPMFNPA